MKKQPSHKISVIIPTYNRSALVRQAIDSALSQTYAPDEIIVIDDGSTDDTKKVLRTYGERIRYFHKENEGIAKTRNFGIQKARGNWVAFLDSDDVWYPKRLENQVAFLNKHPEVSFISADYAYVSGQRRIQKKSVLEYAPKKLRVPTERVLSRDEAFGLLLRMNFVATSSVLMKKEVLGAVNGFDENLEVCEDRDLWLRCSKIASMLVLSEKLLERRIMGQNLRTDLGRMHKNAARMWEKNQSLCEENTPVFNIYRMTMANNYYQWGNALFNQGESLGSFGKYWQGLKTRPNLQNTSIFLSTVLKKGVRLISFGLIHRKKAEYEEANNGAR